MNRKPLPFRALTGGLLLIASFLFGVKAQSLERREPWPEWGRNSISILHRGIQAFDHNGMWMAPHLGRLYPNGVGLSLEYRHQFTRVSGYLVSAGLTGRYYEPPTGRVDPNWGIVTERHMANLDVAYVSSLPLHRRLSLHGIAGLGLRYGREWIQSWYWGLSDVYTYEGYRLADVGVLVGGGAEILLPWHLRLGLDARFTEYVVRTDRTRYPDYGNYAGRGATRHMLVVQVGLGYRFAGLRPHKDQAEGRGGKGSQFQ